MRLPSTPGDAALAILSLALLPQPVAAFWCNNVVVDDQKYDLSALDGAHSVVMSRDEGASYLNTTYTVDICRPLKKKGDVPKDQQCPNGSRGTSTSMHVVCLKMRRGMRDLLILGSIVQSAPSSGR